MKRSFCQVTEIYGDPDDTTWFWIDGDVRPRPRFPHLLNFFVSKPCSPSLCVPGKPVGVRCFNQVSSVHNTAVERHWADVNLVTRKWKIEFKTLESLGAFTVGDYGDMFSLISVYFDAVVSDVNGHYLAMRNRKKTKDTKNPDFPQGMQRRWELYSLYEDQYTKLSTEQIDEVERIAMRHSDYGPDDPQVSGWQVDPLEIEEDRDERAAALRRIAPHSLAEEYLAHRSFTQSPVDTDLTGESAHNEAGSAAMGGVLELRRRIEASRR